MLLPGGQKLHVITNVIPTAAIFYLSHAQAGKPDPDVKPTLQLKNSSTVDLPVIKLPSNAAGNKPFVSTGIIQYFPVENM